MKQTKSPRPGPARSKPKIQPARPTEAPLITWPMLVIVGLALLVLLGVAIAGTILIPKATTERPVQNDAIETALAATGFTPPPSPQPGTDFQIDVVILGKRDYTPAYPGEQINLVLINSRQKSFFVSECDGVILQRFTGGDPKDKVQQVDNKNWHSVAPGGFKYCGPVSGRDAKQVEPGVKADASFKFDIKQTRPFKGESWDIPGLYRLLVTYYLNCPDASLKASDCLDQHSYSSDTFNIVAPPAGYTPDSQVYPTPGPTITVPGKP